jgi:hypothetical protein
VDECNNLHGVVSATGLGLSPPAVYNNALGRFKFENYETVEWTIVGGVDEALKTGGSCSEEGGECRLDLEMRVDTDRVWSISLTRATQDLAERPQYLNGYDPSSIGGLDGMEQKECEAEICNAPSVFIGMPA